MNQLYRKFYGNPKPKPKPNLSKHMRTNGTSMLSKV